MATTERYEKRSAAAVAVMLTSRDRVCSTELTLTENISGRGARIVTKTLWSANDSLVIKSLEGDLQSEARVIYRQSIRENVYAIGLELITGEQHPAEFKTLIDEAAISSFV